MKKALALMLGSSAFFVPFYSYAFLESFIPDVDQTSFADAYWYITIHNLRASDGSYTVDRFEGDWISGSVYCYEIPGNPVTSGTPVSVNLSSALAGIPIQTVLIDGVQVAYTDTGTELANGCPDEYYETAFYLFADGFMWGGELSELYNYLHTTKGISELFFYAIIVMLLLAFSVLWIWKYLTRF